MLLNSILISLIIYLAWRNTVLGRNNRILTLSNRDLRLENRKIRNKFLRPRQ